MDSRKLIKRLKSAGMAFESGMTARELDKAEAFFGFHFPNEIRRFLAQGVPVGDRFFDYRDLVCYHRLKQEGI